MINQVTLVGRLGQNPEIKILPNGTKVCKFSIAVSRSVKVNNGYEYATDWFNVTCFNNTAERLATHGFKGLQVIVSGRLQINKYEKQDGALIKEIQIIADRVIFSIPKQDQQQDSSPNSTAWNQDDPQESLYGEDDLPF